MTEKRDKDCNLKVTRNGRSECWSLCSKHRNDFRCCLSCNESGYCKKICGYLRDVRKRK